MNSEVLTVPISGDLQEEEIKLFEDIFEQEIGEEDE